MCTQDEDITLDRVKSIWADNQNLRGFWELSTNKGVVSSFSIDYVITYWITIVYGLADSNM